MSTSKDNLRTKVLALLREERLTANEIARLVDVSPQVVWGIKSHWSVGKYGDAPRPKKVKISQEGHSWAYLLLSEKGEVYLGATTSLRKRIRAHNSPQNDGFTRGRRWHLLAARWFETRRGGFVYESQLKRSMFAKSEWKNQSIDRALKIVRKHCYKFDPQLWSGTIETF